MMENALISVIKLCEASPHIGVCSQSCVKIKPKIFSCGVNSLFDNFSLSFNDTYETISRI